MTLAVAAGLCETATDAARRSGTQGSIITFATAEPQRSVFFSFSPFTGHRTSAVTSVARFSYPSVPSRSRHVRRDNEAKEERATDGRRRATFPFPFLLSNPVIHAPAVQDRMDGVKFLQGHERGGKRERENFARRCRNFAQRGSRVRTQRLSASTYGRQAAAAPAAAYDTGIAPQIVIYGSTGKWRRQCGTHLIRYERQRRSGLGWLVLCVCVHGRAISPRPGNTGGRLRRGGNSCRTTRRLGALHGKLQRKRPVRLARPTCT